MAKTNREILTGGKKYVQKQKLKHRVEEVVFDKDARKEYLTGFHKRKVQRQKKAQEYNVEQERLARIEERRKIREEKKEDILRQLDMYNNKLKDLRGVVSDDDEDEDEDNKESEGSLEEWNGFDDEEDQQEEDEEDKVKGILKRKEVYSSNNNDEEQVTTVTIESMEPNLESIEVIAKSNFVDLTRSKDVLKKSLEKAVQHAEYAGVVKPKQKKKKFRYLTKTERRENLRKQKSKKKRD